MLKKFMFLLTMFFAVESHAELSQFPTEFNVTEQWFTWGSAFTIATDEAQLGTLKRKFARSEYQLLDNDGGLQATGKFSFPAIRSPTFDITDKEGLLIGQLKQKPEIWSSPEFQIISPSQIVQAEARGNFFATTFTIIDSKNVEDVIATMSRSLFTAYIAGSDDWKIQIHNPELFSQKEIDYRLLVILAAYQTDCLKSKEASLGFLFDRSSARSSLDLESDNEETLEKLRTELESVSDSLSPAEPTEEDFETVNAIVTQKLNEESQTVDSDDESLNVLEAGFSIMMPMLTEEELSPSQKKALFLMMEHHLDSVE